MQVKKQQLELDMEQPTSSKLGKEYAKDVYCHTVYLDHMQNQIRSDHISRSVVSDSLWPHES